MRFGLLGTGDWAERTHAAGLRAAPDAELVAVWGRDPVKARAVAERHGATAYEDVDALLDAVEAVAVALPPDVQAPLAARAARAGRHLLLDKPVALDPVAADDVVRAADRAGVASVVFFTSRFRPEVAGWLDDVARRRWDGGRATILSSLTGELWETSTWRRQHGGLWDVGPHALSLLLPVLGRVSQVEAAQGPHATTTVLLGHESGATSTMTLSLRAPAAAITWDVSFYGPDGWVSAPAGGDPVEAYARAVGELAGTAAAGRSDHPCGVRFGREVVQVLASADPR